MYSAFSRNKTVAAPTGSKLEPEYHIEFDKNGHKVLKQHGETNIYELIQESYEDTKIDNIIARATLGDSSVLQLAGGQYLDVTSVPTSLAEMQNMIIKAENEFNKLPVDIKAKFDNSAAVYISKYGSEEFNTLMGFNEAKEAMKEIKELEGGKKLEQKLTE